METANGSTTRRVLLLTHARTASHLLERMLSKQPNVSYASHFFARARPLQVRLVEEGPLEKTSRDHREELFRTWQEGFANFERFVSEAEEKGSIAFVHGHPHFMLSPVLASQYIHGEAASGQEQSWTVLKSDESEARPRTNPTILPDAFLLQHGTVPIFTIRDPMLMVPSIYRAIVAVENKDPSMENLLLSGTLRWSRMLYDWYLEQGATGISPLVVDAKDISSSRAVVEALCRQAGLVDDHVIYQWPRSTEDELRAMPPFIVEIKKDILHSEGLIPGKGARDLVPEQEEEKWREEFGTEAAALLRDLVARTKPDYEYLLAKAIKG